MSVRAGVDQAILDNFWNLCETKTADRLNSAKLILEIIQKEEEQQQATSINYCLKRVVKGLSSSRKFARRGFSMFLSELLFGYPNISMQDVFKIAEESFGKASEGDTAATIGWVMAISSLIASGALARSSKADRELAYQTLVKIGLVKGYVEVTICELIASSIKDGKISPEEFAQAILPQLLKETPKSGKQTLYSVFFYVLLRQETPVQQKIDFLQESYFDSLAVLVKTSTEHLPYIHPALKQLVESALSSDLFGQFWTKVIESPLYESNQPEKIALALHLFDFALPLSDATTVRVLISQNFMRTFLHSLRNKNYALNKQANEISAAIVRSVAARSEADYQLAILESLTTSPGSLIFDDISRSKLLQNVVMELSGASLKKWMKKLRRAFYKTSEIDENDLLRITSIKQIGFCVKNNNFNNEELQIETLQFLMINSFFSLEAPKQLDFCDLLVATPITENLRNVLRLTFWKALEAICKTNSRTTKERHNRESTVLQTLKLYEESLLENDILTVTAEVKTHQLNVNNVEYNTEEEELNLGFSIIDGVLHLWMLIEPEPASAALSELHDCYKRASKKKKKKTDVDQPQWADVLVDMAISTLSRGIPVEVCNLLISGCSCFAKHVTKESATILNDVLLTTALDEDPDDMSVDDEGSDDENESEMSEEDEELEDGEKVNEADLKFRNDLMMALGPAAAINGDEEDIADDEQMLQLDEAISEVFRQKFSAQKEQKENKAALIDLKMRCCDLANVFLTSDASIDFVLRLLPSLIGLSKNACVAKSYDIALGKKALKLLFQITKLKKLKNSDDEGVDGSPKEVLDICFVNINKFSQATFQKLLAQLSAWIVNNTTAEQSDHVSKFRNELNNFFVKRTNHVAKDTFTPLLEINEMITLSLLEVIVEKIQDENVRLYHRTAGLSLLTHGVKYLQSKQFLAQEYLELQSSVEKILCQQLKADLSEFKGPYLNELLVCLNTLPNKTLDKDTKDKLKSIGKATKKKLHKSGTSALNKLIK